MAFTAGTPIELVQQVYATLPDRVATAERRLGRRGLRDMRLRYVRVCDMSFLFPALGLLFRVVHQDANK